MRYLAVVLFKFTAVLVGRVVSYRVLYSRMYEEGIVVHRSDWHGLDQSSFFREGEVAVILVWWPQISCFSDSGAIQIIMVDILVMSTVVGVALSRIAHMMMRNVVPHVDDVAGML